jgi:hypothetical protein
MRPSENAAGISDESSMSPLLIFNIATASMSLRKGSPGHRTGGTVFVIGMVWMTAGAIPLGLLKTQTLNALVGALTCYLVASGWMAGRRDGFNSATSTESHATNGA